jgi:glyoxylase-like metal-dependent hydrolase (beta-lactamase superfamily II)
MKVHHLNCGSMHPPRTPMLVCHVLLLETDSGLVLVDAGFGKDDCADPPGRVGPVRFITRPVLVPTEAAAHQIEQLGFRREDVRHIVVTHFDSDHVGGISDFPHAQVHVTAAEAFAAFNAPTRQERFRYARQQWATERNVVEHSPEGEAWRGFAAAKELDNVAPGIVLVSLPGHTRGHICVAVDAGNRWLLHCGDAFFHCGTLEGTQPPRSLWAWEKAVALDRKKVRDNHARLIELYRRAEPDLFLINSHDLALYERAKATA